MKSYEGYMCELNTIDIELKRINDHAKNLRLQRTRVLGALYRYMCANNLDKVSYGKRDISIKQCTPREKKITAKPKKEKKRDAIELFRDMGIPNPDKFYQEFEETQKRAPNTNESSSTNTNTNDQDDLFGPSKKKKGPSGGYDARLGF